MNSMSSVAIALKKGHTSNGKRLFYDCPTKWNSIYFTPFIFIPTSDNHACLQCILQEVHKTLVYHKATKEEQTKRVLCITRQMKNMMNRKQNATCRHSTITSVAQLKNVIIYNLPGKTVKEQVMKTEKNYYPPDPLIKMCLRTIYIINQVKTDNKNTFRWHVQGKTMSTVHKVITTYTRLARNVGFGYSHKIQ